MIRNYEAVNSETARLIDLNADYLGVSDRQLMENAGRAVAEEIAHRFPVGSEVVVYAGIGRNGGDGLVAARHLACRGFKVKVLLLGSGERIRDNLTWLNYQAVRNMRFTVELVEVRDSRELKPVKADVIVDSLLGTGVKGVLREPMLTAVKTLNDSEGFKVSVDVPSGVDSDTGQVLGEAVKADLTLTFHRLKIGLKEASSFCGELKVVDIGIPPEAEFTAGPGDLALVARARSPESHKGDFGRLLVIGGSEVYTGAPALAALAALRVGVDLAYVAAPEETAKTISSFTPDLITIKMEG
ncbi:MAG: NAD(P)H-hydrate epimerase, partial [Candidatus Bathyarchaeia archaeon]